MVAASPSLHKPLAHEPLVHEPQTHEPLSLLRLGLACYQQGNLHGALDHFGQIPPQAMPLPALVWSGLCEFQLAHYAEAAHYFQQARMVEPWQAGHSYNLGLSYHELGDLQAAYQAYSHAISLQDDHAEAYNNRAIIEAAQGNYRAAVIDYSTALSLDESLLDARFNRAVAYAEQLAYRQAIAEYQQVLLSDPGHTAAHFALGVANLILGNWPLGWQQYEGRWECPELALKRPEIDALRWDGLMPLTGKRVLLHWEQGFGDTLQFCRLAHCLHDAGADLTLVVQPELYPLLLGLDGVDRVVDKLTDHAYDYHLTLLSLPAALDLQLGELPGHYPYLQPPEAYLQRWRHALGPRLRPRIGLAWRGNPLHHNDRRRSLPLALLLEQLPPQLDYYLLHPELTDQEAQLINQTTGLSIQPPLLPLGDFADTAALCHELDLIISVDTCLAHLAGAMGKPLWLLLPFNPDWRWLLGRDDSPWYPGARLWRQPAPDDWHSVLGRIAAALQQHDHSH